MADDVELVDRELTCRDCGETFTFSIGEQRYFRDHGFGDDPIRCPSCRRLVREATRAHGADGSARICKRCRSEFNLSKRDRDWFVARDLHVPVHCERCRRERREAREAIATSEGTAP